MGILGYNRKHIRGFAKIARPISELTKKGKDFEWTEECRQALNELINRVKSDPVLRCPDPGQPFELEVDASAFAIGAVLRQRDEKGDLRDIGFFSKALNQTEHNYDIWDREFMAVVFGLRHWRHLLAGSPHPVIVWTDHVNLQYYRHPQKINRRVARYIALLSDYNLVLKHLPGIKNRADALSRRPDHANGQNDNEDTTALPDQLFARGIEIRALEEMIRQDQKQNQAKIKLWKEKET